METGIKVGDIMTRNFIHTPPETDLRECAKIMVKKRVGSLIIKTDEKLAGIITEKDIIWAIVKKSKKELKNILAKDLMRRKVITIKPSADITEAMKKYRKKKIRRLPVVENGKLIGMLTIKDVLKIDPGLFQMIAESVKVREETEKLSRRGPNNQQTQGICEECGEFEILSNAGAQWICETCFSKR